MEVGIAIDDWKALIFERHLKQSGYTYKQCALAEGAQLLLVTTDNAEALGKVVYAANTECRMRGNKQ
jgi:hypothetical protein